MEEEVHEEPDDPVQVWPDDPLHRLEGKAGGTFASFYMSFSFTYLSQSFWVFLDHDMVCQRPTRISIREYSLILHT